MNGRGYMAVLLMRACRTTESINRVDCACQPAGLVAVRETGVMWANMLRAFQVGNALTSDGEPSSRMRPLRTASAQASWPACHLTKASASAVM